MNRALGTQYEEKAMLYLEKQGYRILEKNVNYRWGEIDIVAMDEALNDLVFVEVRYRSEQGMVSPEESITPTKIKRLKRAIETYLVSPSFFLLGLHPNGIRIDLVGFEGESILHWKSFI